MKEIQLTKGKVALVDDEDFVELSKYKWCYSGRYAQRNRGDMNIYMHRQIMNYPEDMDVDHVNSDCLDNRKLNLRVCTHKENIRNSCKRDNTISGYKGVRPMKGKWQAYIDVDGMRLYLGVYDDIISAAKSYDDAAEKHFGKYARKNL